jgi:hypothetical protein
MNSKQTFWAAVLLIGLCICLISTACLKKPAIENKAGAKPPFTIEECDEWLKEAGLSVVLKATLERHSRLSEIATACYLSHMVTR